MPRKIRQLLADLRRAGSTLRPFLRRRSGPPEPRIDPDEFFALRAVLVMQGYIVIVGEEAAKYLDLVEAEASYMPTDGTPGIFRWREDPSRAAVAEEVHHAAQHRQANWQVGDQRWLCEREIEAQEWLYAHAKSRGWTKREMKRFRAARAYWIGEWERLTGRRYR